MKLLVTGATGFVGRHLTDDLGRRRISGHALARSAVGPLPEGVTALAVRSFDDADALDRACEGCTVVVHLAGRAHVMKERSRDPLGDFRRVNVDGTRAILAAAARSGVERFVFVSTIKVNGEGRERPYTGQDVPAPADLYAVSKLEAEHAVREFGGRLATVVVRPPLIYGPGVKGNFLRLLQLTRAARTLPLPLGSLQNRRSLVYVGNFVDALIHVARAPAAPGNTFVVSDNEDLSTPELIHRLGRAAGFTPRLLPFPESILRGASRLLGMRAAIERLAGSLTVDPSALIAAGWAPPYTADEGYLRGA
jgi:UDP-glucose 4-epimerase